MIQWVVLTLAVAAVVSLAIWSRRPTRARDLSTVALFVVPLIAAGTIFHSHGWPVPMIKYLSVLPDGDYPVLGVKMVPGVATYVLLDVGAEPRLFVLPWNAKQASKGQRMQENPQGEMRMRIKSGDEDTESEFVEEPQGGEIAKAPPEAPAPQYQRQGE